MTRHDQHSPAASHRGSGTPYGVFTDVMPTLVSYRYLGCSSVAHDRHHAEGRMRIRTDMRTPGGVLGAPWAIAMLDTAGINVDRLYLLALTQADVHFFDGAHDVSEIRVVGKVTREARSQLFTEAHFEDAAVAGRVVGFGSANWAVLSTTPEDFVYVDPGPGVPDAPDLPPLYEAYEVRRRDEGGFMIPGLSPRVGTDTLHHGPMLVSLEFAARELAGEGAGSRRLTLDTLTTRIVTAGRVGPFATSGGVLSETDRTVACRTELRDLGRDAVVAVSMARFRISDD